MGVKGGGCSGMSYSLEFDTEMGPHDREFELEGIKVVVDKKSPYFGIAEYKGEAKLEI
jgi:iron-sulfur cluster assembly protein